MRLLSLGLALSHALLFVSAEQFDIPQIDAAVRHVLEEYPISNNTHGPEPDVHVKPKTNVKINAPEAPGQAYWYEQIAKQGRAPYAPSGFAVYRNVKDYGAKGDGTTDDTAAINAAIAAGGTCGKGCPSSTTTPSIVYFPAGTYLISSPINQAYYSQLIGNPNNIPTIKATASFGGLALIDANPYYTQFLNWGSTNVFFRQIRNLNIDTRNIPASTLMRGIHWPTAQATSIQNVQFQLSSASGTQHVGLFIEEGSAGFLADLTFNGGFQGANLGNQQYMVRNLVFNNAITAISMTWDWSFAYKSISINNCQVGLDISSGGSSAQQVGSVTLYDSSITNTPIGVKTAWTTSSSPASAGSVILENVVLNNVPTAVQGPNGVVLAGGSTTIAAWGEGHQYTPNGPSTFQNAISGNSRPAGLLSGSKYYEQSKPQFQDLAVSSFVSARSSGAKGDGSSDDTSALQSAINSAASAGKVLFLEAGVYIVTNTITIPAGSKIVGESYPVIMSSGSYFNNQNSPQAVVRVGTSGSTGQVQWTDTVVSTRGAQAGAILIEYNLATSGTPSGLWDVHTRIGGFTGTNLQVAQCPTSAAPGPNCLAAFMAMHITASASNVYLENNWFWSADHDIDSSGNTQISVYSGRGLFVESTAGNIWLSGTASEHFTLYQYQFSGTKNIYLGQPQTETPYYQPNPTSPTPWTVNSALKDPNFASSCAGQSGNCAAAWGFRTLNSNGIFAYGAGFYSFFDNYSTTCSQVGNGEACQANIVDLESSSNINFYGLNTVGTTNMVTINGASRARYSDNINVFPDTIALFRSG
ncbi:MAG: hypothetical protein M1820_004205 [Bogoriella megaspora]|nr:MAG: hypothetical protein M1820_004205 [Bogoriella megaspora]